MGTALLAFPSLLGIYAMVYLYITNISFWSIESYLLVILSLTTVGYDLYTVRQGTFKKWTERFTKFDENFKIGRTPKQLLFFNLKNLNSKYFSLGV